MSDVATTRWVIQALVRESGDSCIQQVKDRLLAIARGEDQDIFNEVVNEMAAKRAATAEQRYAQGRNDRDWDARLLQNDGEPEEILRLADCISKPSMQESSYWRGWMERHFELTATASGQA